MERELKYIVSKEALDANPDTNASLSTVLEVPDFSISMFKIRYSLERQIRQLWETTRSVDEIQGNVPSLPTIKMTRELLDFGYIDSKFFHILRENLAICNHAIHGGKISSKQQDFVEKYSAYLLNYLQNKSLSY